jgi:hypothetical protein
LGGIGKLEDVRIILLLFVALFASSCVRPSCASWAYGGGPRTDREHFATIQVYSKPIQDPAKRYSTGMGLRGQFEQGASFTIDSDGRMKVTRLDVWPRHCPRGAADSRPASPSAECVAGDEEPISRWR